MYLVTYQQDEEDKNYKTLESETINHTLDNVFIRRTE